MALAERRSIGLKSRPLYANDSAYDVSQILSSEPLLDEDLSNPNRPRETKSRTIGISKALNKLRRSTTRAGNNSSENLRPKSQGRSRLCLKIGGCFLLLLGVIQLFSLIGSIIVLILPDRIHRVIEYWGKPGHIGAGLSSWPTDFTRDILPIPCHSHNDYWRNVPLYSAIEVGCIGVEADVWLFDKQLYVGHSIASLTPNRTLASLYVNPLLDILSKQNPKRTLFPERVSELHGVFDTNPEQTLILLIDFKTPGNTLWPYVQAALEPLRNRSYLTRSNGTEVFPGPITVVGTGNTPFDLVNSNKTNPHHDVFFDAPLSDMSGGVDRVKISGPVKTGMIKATEVAPETMTTKANGAATQASETRSDEQRQGRSGARDGDANVYNQCNSFYASVAFGHAIGELSNGDFSESQLQLLRKQIKGAHEKGLKARYWDLPFWPISLRNHVWDVLVKEGVDLLNVDDLNGAARRDWDKYRGW